MTFWTFNLRDVALAFVATYCLGGPAVSLAQADEPTSPTPTLGRDEAIEQWFQFLGNLNNSSLLEPAGSHGSIGLALGAGGSSHLVPESGSEEMTDGGVTAAFLDRDGTDTAPYLVPRAWALKGLPWPVDLGISAAVPKDKAFTQVAGIIQWTVYEEFARPALTLRGGYARLFGLPETEISSTNIDAVISYGFLRYFTLYAAGGGTRHTATLAVRDEETLDFLLVDAESEVSKSKTWVAASRAIGLKITVLPPFIALTGEARDPGDGSRSYAIKLGIGM